MNSRIAILFCVATKCCSALVTVDTDCGVSDYVAGNQKCVWIERGGNLTMSEYVCDRNGGTLFTFDTLDEGQRLIDVLDIGENITVFIGAVQNKMNDFLYYDWLSRPGTWSVAIQSEIENELNASTDDSCLVLENRTLRRESCSSEMNITVCEKDGCSCANLSDGSMTRTIKIDKPLMSTNIPTLSPESPDISSDNSMATPDDATILVPELANITVDRENKSTNYCDYVDVLNITFADLIDQILAQTNKENVTGSSCQGQGHVGVTEVTETTVKVEEEKSTIPVTEVKFHFVSGIEYGPAMTGAKFNPPLRIDKHSKDYSLLVNISRELMEFQSTKHVTNDTLMAFAETIGNWSGQEELIKETTNVKKDLFEDILQVGEDLVGNLTTEQDDVKVTSGSIDILQVGEDLVGNLTTEQDDVKVTSEAIDIVSKIVRPTDNATHTVFDLEQDSRNVDIRLANTIFNNKTVRVRVSAITYNGVDTIVKRVDMRVASPVISVSVKYIRGKVVEKQSISTDEAIIFAMRTFLHKTKKEQSRLCTYWSFSRRQWSTTGCSVIQKNSSYTTCKCNHLTNFAILVMYMDADDISLQSQQVLFTLTTVGCSLSIACLAMTLITYVYLRMLGNEKIMIHANLSLALLMAQIVFVSSHDAHNHKTACKVVALMLHFLFMASFSWMMVEGIALYMTCTRGILANINRDMKLRYFLIGWGLPAVVVIISCAAQFPNYGAGPQYSCWLSTQDGLIWAFLGPMLVIVLLNMVVMGLVVKVFLTLRTNTEKSELARLRGSLRAMMTLLPLLGLGWILSLLVPFSVVFNYFFVIVNTLQGMCIFFLHCICNEEIRKMFREKRRRWSTTRTASDFDITFHARRKTGSFDGIRTVPATVASENGRRQIWIESRTA